MGNLVGGSSVLFLGLFKDMATVGSYAAVERTARAEVMAMMPASQAAYPHISQRFHESLASGTHLCLLIGDDILPEPDCLEVHRDFHLSRPAREEVALGWTRWDKVHQRVTPFMRWYEELQFDYGSLRTGLYPTWKHFYTSNLSFKTSLLQDNPFEERFRDAAWEDIELGFRLMTAGQARLTFLEDAVATHIHPTTFIQATRRMQILGHNERIFHCLWPAAPLRTATNVKSRICTFLGTKPAFLDVLTFLANHVGNLLRPGKLHAMLLRSHQQRGKPPHHVLSSIADRSALPRWDSVECRACRTGQSCFHRPGSTLRQLLR